DRHFAVQMFAVALENRVLAHRDLHIQITGRATARAGFTFTGQTDAITGINPRRHIHRQGLGLFDDTAAVTLAAGVGDHIALAATVRAGLLHREETLLHAHLTGTGAGRTGDGRAALLGAAAGTFVAGDQGRHANFCGGA